jgi:hypothetical protein
MPLTRKIHSPGRAAGRFPVQRSRGLSGAADAISGSRIFATLLAFFAMLIFLSPGTGLAARLAGEEQPVTAAPAGPPATSKTPEPKGVQVKSDALTPASTAAGQKAATSQTPAAPRTVSPAAPGGATAVPQTVTTQTGVTGMPAGNAPVQGVGRRSPVAPPAGAETPSPVATAAGPKPAETSPAPSQKASPQSGRYVTIDFDNVDITVFIKFVSELTGKNFLIEGDGHLPEEDPRG